VTVELAPIDSTPDAVERDVATAPETMIESKAVPEEKKKRSRLQRYKRYPSEAQARSEQGVVLLSFSLDRTGHVLAHRIARSSGFADLDAEVMAMIMRAEPLPALPTSVTAARLDLTVPIRFSLR
jgi:periplasmic protein TonB